MSAALNTTERGPKTTKAARKPRKVAAKVDHLAAQKAKEHAAVDLLYAAAHKASHGYPRLADVVDQWIAARREEADYDATHTVLDAAGDDHEGLKVACDEWHEKIDAAADVALSILDIICVDRREADAKVETFLAMFKGKPEEFRDFASAPLAIVESLRRDLQAMGETQPPPTSARTAWDNAYDAWRAAEDVKIPDGATDAEGRAICDAAAAAHAALIRLPAPDLAAIAAKISFVGEFTRGRFLDEEIARDILKKDEWTLQCVAAAYLDLERMISEPQADGLLLALGAELERRWRAEHERAGAGCSDEELSHLNDAAGKIARQIQALRATTIAGLRVKARAALFCQGAPDATEFNLGSWSRSALADVTVAGSIVNDLLASPTVVPAAHADAALIDAAIQFQVLADEFDNCGNDRVGGPNDADRQRYHDLSEAKQPHLDVVKSTPATTLDGLRAKALVATWYQPSCVFVEHDDLEWQLHRSLTDDLLGTGPKPVNLDAELIARADDFIAKRTAWVEAVNAEIATASKAFDETASPFAELNQAQNHAYDRLVELRAQTPAGVAALARALRAFQCASAEPTSFDPGEVPPHELMRAVCDSALDLSAAGSLDASRARFEQARTGFLKAREEETALDNEIHSRSNMIKETIVPVPPRLRSSGGEILMPHEIEGDEGLAAQDKAELLKLREAWAVLSGDASQRLGLRVLDDAAAKANVRTYHALFAYLQTPPHCISALRTQVRDAINYDVLPNGQTADDIDGIRSALDDDDARSNYLAIFYQHLTRLTGEPGAFLGARRDFDTNAAEGVGQRSAKEVIAQVSL